MPPHHPLLRTLRRSLRTIRRMYRARTRPVRRLVMEMQASGTLVRMRPSLAAGPARMLRPTDPTAR
jgi:hypothetical protein